MKSKFKLLIAIVLVAPLLTVAVVQAATSQPATPKPGSSFQQRLTQRKAEQKVKLSREDKLRLIDQCRSAQTKLRVVQTDTSPIVDNRLAVYKRIDAKLWVMVGRIKLANKDTFKLEKSKTAYDTMIDNFKITTDNYQQAIGDMILVNCKADPEGFLALLQTGRLYHDQIQTQIAAMRKYVANNIKADLTYYSNLLQPQNNGGNQ